ncbi:MAG TPA: nucleotidyltransferase family protein [Limnochordia bacterium]
MLASPDTRVDAIVLAGAENDGKLRRASPCAHEALIEIGGKPMVAYVIAALRESGRVRRIVVVGPDPELGRAIAGLGVEFVPCGQRMVENLRIGIQHLSPGRQVLIVTSDIPLLTAAAVIDFLDRCAARQADIYYPIIERRANESRFPGAHRTYVRLRDGVFTGGNLVLLEPGIVERCQEVIERAVAMRKKPWQLSRLLGPRFIVKFICNRLTLAEIEERVEKILGCRGAAIVTPFPEIGIDVDKPADLALVSRFLNGAPGA